LIACAGGIGIDRNRSDHAVRRNDQEEKMSERNVPFLLNGASAKNDSWFDRFLWTLAGYFRRRRFSGFDQFLSGIETIVDFGGRRGSG
jgi:hypothetical protein